MFWVIARHQIRLLLRERAWVTVGFLCVGMAYALGNGLWQLRRERAAQAAFLNRSREVIVRNQQLAAAIERRIAAGEEREQAPPPFGTRHPSYAGTWSVQPALLPPSPLEWLASGQSDLYSSAYGGPELNEVNQIGNPLALSVGHWDLSAAIVFLLPLAILALGFDLIASERESGVWSLTRSQPVRGSTVLLAKWAAVSGLILATLSVVFIGAVVATGWSQDFGMTLRLCLAALATLIYAGFWLALLLAINTLKRSAAQNALICAAGWLLFVVFLPFAIDQIATHSYPVEPHSTLANAERSAAGEADRVPLDELVLAFIARHNETRIPSDLSSLGRLYLERAARAEEIGRINDTAHGRWEAQLQSQQAAADGWAWLSPPALLANALIELAGTGRARYIDFMGQKREFERKYDALFLPRRLALPNSIFTAADYSLIPTMEYKEEQLAKVVERVLPRLLGLAFISGTLFALVTISLIVSDAANPMQ